MVGSTVTVTLDVISHHPINSGSKIIVSMPGEIWSAVDGVVAKQCSLVQGGSTFSGCSWAMTGEWVRELNVTLSQNVAENATLTISFTATNAWSARSLINRDIAFYVANSADTYVSEGTLNLQVLYQAQNLETAPLNSISI